VTLNLEICSFLIYRLCLVAEVVDVSNDFCIAGFVEALFYKIHCHLFDLFLTCTFYVNVKAPISIGEMTRNCLPKSVCSICSTTMQQKRMEEYGVTGVHFKMDNLSALGLEVNNTIISGINSFLKTSIGQTLDSMGLTSHFG
jgi:hypothetical protein